jgi:sialate O-acetylesterase
MLMFFKSVFRSSLAAWCLFLSLASGAVSVAPPLGSNMVLQRGKPVPVAGKAAANKGITVSFNGQTKTTTSDAAGNWHVSLDPMVAKVAGGNLTAAETGANTVTLSNVVVGDVWICGGQSNMDMILGSCNRQVDIDSANYPVMRQFRAPLVQSGTPLKTVSGNWVACSPSTASGFSAVAFYFGRKICQDQGSAIPIGLYLASVGGTTIDPWLAPEGAIDIPVLAPLYSQPVMPSGPFRLFNGMVYPYAHLPAKGMIWYQGENAQSTTQSPDSYYLKMKALAQGYKRMLGMDDFAFYFVQLAYWGQQQTSPEPVLFSGGWDADTRIQQARAMALPHSGMASAMDVGSSLDGDQIWDGWHPKDKYDVGERLALWALKNDYGRPIETASGPVLRDVTVSGSSLVCAFDHVGSGLMVGSKAEYLPTVEVVGGALDKFSIAGATGPWYDAIATIVGNTVVVSHPSVPTPRKVSYACWQNPVGANLYNKVTLDGVSNGLPASPFHIDDVTAKFTITASAGAGGSISPAGATSFLKRATTLYTITPDPGQFIQDVKVDGVSVGAVKYFTFDPIDANHTIAATFAATAPGFTIAASASGGGSLTPSGTVSVTQGASQGFTVSSTSGANVALTVDGKPLGPRTSYVFADVRENHTIGATFTIPITAQAGYGGSISPTGTTYVTYGGNQTYTITPQSGFTISKVTVDGVNVGTGASHTFNNVITSHSITATFTGSGGGGGIPQSGKIYCSFLTDNLPASGNISSWASYLPAGKTLTQQNAPSVEVIDGRKFVKNVANDADCLNLGTVASAIPCTGATIVVVAKPSLFGSDPGWTSIVDFFYDRLVLGIMNGTGKVVVRRNGSLETSSVTIPDGQTTILSLVVQQNGTYKVFANGVEVMNVTSTSDMSAIVPGIAGGFANNVTFGRNWPDGWTTYNGYYGDSFVYTTALADSERQQLETYLVNRLTATGATFTISSSAGTGGSISPTGAVIVNEGADQTFTITPDTGYAISGVTVDGGGIGAVASHTFNDVGANHTIAASFVATGNLPPSVSSVADQDIAVNSSTPVLAFTVGDTTTAAADLTVVAVSSNTTLVPNANIVLGGGGAGRTVRVTPAAGQTGETTITLSVSDGSLTASTSFVVTVAAAGASKAVSINVGLNGVLAPSDVAGVVPVAGWNELSGSSNPSTSVLLDESGGAVPGMSVSFQGNVNTFNNTGVPDQTMLSGFLSGNPMVAQFSNIPYARYDVYVYYAGFNNNNTYSLTWVATDTATATVVDTRYSVRGSLTGPQLFPTPGLVRSEYATLAEAAAQAALGNGGNWLRFTGLSAANLRISETSESFFHENGFSGVQIVNTSPVNTFGTWIAGFPGLGNAAGFNDDADGDGISNGLENHLGTDPTESSSGLTDVASSGRSFVFRHTRSNEPASDVSALYQWSTDLGDWFGSGQTNGQGVSATIASTVITDTNAPDNDLVEVTVMLTEGSAAGVFARIECSQIP